MTAITNVGAVTRDESGNTICDRSGRKAYPHELVKDPEGNMVLPRYLDEPQRETRAYRSTSGTGSKRAEQDNNFITTAVLATDL